MGLFLDFLIIPFIATYFILILKWKSYNLHIFSLLVSIIIFYYSIYILIIFNKSVFLYQFIESYYLNFQFFNNFEYLVGIDNISLFFILLTAFILPIIILYLRQFLKYKYFKNFILYVFFLIFFLKSKSFYPLKHNYSYLELWAVMRRQKSKSF
jgi:NADH:ubiquinone oxidoreductase subunit 4 (subunit M)